MTPLRERMIEDMPAWRQTGSFTASHKEPGKPICMRFTPKEWLHHKLAKHFGKSPGRISSQQLKRKSMSQCAAQPVREN